MRGLTLSLLAVLLCACATQPAQTPEKVIRTPAKLNSTYYVAVPDVDELAFHGQLDTDVEGSVDGGMMYPGYDAASFLVAIATHAVIADTMNDKRKAKALDAADEVLEPYQPLIDAVSPGTVLKASIALLESRENMLYTVADAATLPPGNNWSVNIEPVYILSASEDSISLEARISIFESRYSGKLDEAEVAYSRVMYLKSSPVAGRDVWLDSEGQAFRSEVNELLADALQLALEDFNGVYAYSGKPQRTIRYLDNSRKKVERGRLIRTGCTHVLFESLRGKLKSVPVIPGSTGDECRAVL